MKTRAALFALTLTLSGAVLPALPVHAQLFGESDAEKAARQAHENNQDSQINQLGGRITQLEGRVQSLTQSLATVTGANEELSHQLQLLRQKVDAQQKDFAYRLCMLSAQVLGADSGPQGLNCAAAGAATTASTGNLPQNYTPGTPLPPLGSADQGASAAAAGAPQQLGRPPGILGTLPASSLPQNGGGNTATAAAPAGQESPQSNPKQFDSAMNLLAKAQYAEASAAFRSYADNNPDDKDLAPQAIYWVGDIAYVQHDYPTAAHAFAEQIKKYPDSNRSPDSMLKLGQSLIAEGQTRGGCTTLAALKTKYPKAPASTLTAAEGARKAACRR